MNNVHTYLSNWKQASTLPLTVSFQEGSLKNPSFCIFLLVTLIFFFVCSLTEACAGGGGCGVGGGHCMPDDGEGIGRELGLS